MDLIRNGEVLAVGDDFVPDGNGLPDSEPITISAERWLAHTRELRHRGKVSVRLTGGFEVERLAGQLAGLDRVEVDFPTFTDGRGYTVARLLRERLGYRGELRAVGDVLPDQLGYLLRCGFDAFRLKPGKSADTALAALRQLPLSYQPAADAVPPRWRV